MSGVNVGLCKLSVAVAQAKVESSKTIPPLSDHVRDSALKLLSDAI